MRKSMCLALIAFAVFLSGCWDQRLFKDAKLALAGSFDTAKKGQLRLSVSVPNISKTSQGPGQEMIQILSVVAHTPRAARVKLDQETAKQFDASKMKVVLIGQALAKKKIYPLLDIFYRDPESALSANLAIVAGRAKDALTVNASGETKPSNYLSGLLDGARTSTFAGKEETIQGITGKMKDPGTDVTIPLLKVDKQKGVVKVTGLALFHGESYTGKYLSPPQSTLFLLMKNQMGKIARLSEKVYKHKKPDLSNYITIEVKDRHPKIKVTVDHHGKVSAMVNLRLNVRAIEYPQDRLDTEKEINMLDGRLSKLLTKHAQGIINKLQKNNCDAFGIGRRLMAFHPDLWKQIDWEKLYPHFTFTSKVEVNIVQHGIIN